jgi:SAM-dependent methyltransferase
VLGDASASGLPSESADFIWGEDAWCYVEDKQRLVAEAARIVRSGGTVAFTDWLAGSTPMSGEEAARFLRFMKFPNILDLDDYRRHLEAVGLEVQSAEDTGRFPEYVDLYLDMLNKQLTYDALKIIGFDMELMGALGGEMVFIQQLAHDGKICQGRLIATRP